MRIVGIRTWIVYDGLRRNWVFVKMDTDEGVHGVGEASLEGKELSVTSAIQELSRYLVGKDPSHIEHHWQVMYRGAGWKGGPVLSTAISALEICMWDIAGKVAGQPVYKLLGGPCRERIHVYTHLDAPKARIDPAEEMIDGEYPRYADLTTLPTPEDAAKQAIARVSQGWDGLKFRIVWSERVSRNGRHLLWGDHWHNISPSTFQRAVDIFAAVREAVGPNIDLMMHESVASYNPATAIRLARACEPYNPFWFEEPVGPENIDSMVQVARATSVPIATGERLFYRWGYRELLEKHGCAVINPTPIHVGGILETRKIAAMAEVYDIDVAPHNPYGPISKAVNLHLAACIPNFVRLEWVEPHIGDKSGGRETECVKLIDWSLKPDKSWVLPPSSPGLGVDLNEEALGKYPYEPKGMGSAPPIFSRYLGYPDLSQTWG